MSMSSIRYLIAIAVILVCSVAHAATFYLRAGATGANDGSDWTNAWTTIRDGSGDVRSEVSRGDLVYVADGSYQGADFDTAASGTTRITIRKATEAVHGTETGWSSTFGDGVAVWTSEVEFVTGYWTFDGAVGGGPTSFRSGHGFRVDMPNAQNAKGIRFRPGNNVFVEHVEIDGSAGSTRLGHDGLYSLGPANDVEIRDCWVHDTGRAPVLINSSDRLLIERSAFEDPNSNSGQHSEIYSASEGGGSNTPDDWVLRYNLFLDPISTGGVITSGFRWKVYGNIFTRIDPNCGSCNNGIFGGWSDQPGGSHEVYNNTFVDFNSSTPPALSGNVGKLHQVAGGSGSINRNNLFCNVNYVSNASTKSHNAFAGSTNPGESNQQILSSDCEVVFTTYGSAGYEDGTDDFSLEAGTDAGQTLAAEFNTDMFGTVRGADGTWDRGAIEFDDTGTSTSSIGGNVSGLSSTMQGLTLQNNGGDDIVVENVSFTFPTLLVEGTTYNVTVSVQPINPIQNCTVANGSGTVPAPNVTDVAVTCSAVSLTSPYNNVLIRGAVLR